MANAHKVNDVALKLPINETHEGLSAAVAQGISFSYKIKVTFKKSIRQRGCKKTAQKCSGEGGAGITRLPVLTFNLPLRFWSLPPFCRSTRVVDVDTAVSLS